jgi:hypothetical protein
MRTVTAEQFLLQFAAIGFNLSDLIWSQVVSCIRVDVQMEPVLTGIPQGWECF